MTLPDAEGPVVSEVVAQPNPVPVYTDVGLFARVDDATTGGSTIASASYAYRIDDGPSSAPNPMNAADGWFDEITEDVSATTAFSTSGVAEICVSGTDSENNVGTPSCIFLAIYDPTGGFVSGSGWIESPSGAYYPDPGVAGRARFAILAKYAQGATTPIGHTQLRFQAADLDFRSTSYDWLILTGSQYARFKGWGTINGGGAYRFMLWAGDGAPDTFRIRIWEEDEATGSERVIYDNGVDQALGGGGIVVRAAPR